MTPRKRLGIGRWIFILLLLGGGFVGWRWYQSRSQTPATIYRTATITRGDLTQSVTANGQINAVKNVTVGSQVSGIITDIRVDFNSRVTNGQVIAQIDPSTYQQNITQMEAELANATAALELAELNMRRSQALYTNSLISASEHDQTVVSLHQAEAVVKMREAALQKAKVDLERTTIYAPIDGVVISRAVDVGQTVAANFNAPTLFNIANDLRNMRIEAMVSEADVGGVREGQQASFLVEAFPGRKFYGTVSQVRYAPITNQNVVNYIAVVDVNNEDLKLRPGMTANTSIIISERNGVLRIPNAALRFRPPEGALVVGLTNRPAGPGGGSPQTTLPGGGSGNVFAPPAETTGGGSGSGERRRQFENMTPEQREQMRARGIAGGRSRDGEDGSVTRTVYTLEGGVTTNAAKPMLSGFFSFLPGMTSSNHSATLKPVTIKTGISDSSFTEVLEGLNERDLVVVGVELSSGARTSTAGATPFGGSPFGGGMRPR